MVRCQKVHYPPRGLGLLRGVLGKTNGHEWVMVTAMVTAVVIMIHGTRRWVDCCFAGFFLLSAQRPAMAHEVYGCLQFLERYFPVSRRVGCEVVVVAVEVVSSAQANIAEYPACARSRFSECFCSQARSRWPGGLPPQYRLRCPPVFMPSPRAPLFVSNLKPA